MVGIGKKNQAYGIIKEKILEGVLPPLCDLSEEELQKELGVSRTPVREAIMMLSEDGFVQIYPRKGTIVTDISMDAIGWMFEARRLNEPYIVRSACGRLPEEWLRKMRQAFDSPPEPLLESAQELRRYYIDLDRELHGRILSVQRNEFLRGMMERVYDHSHRLRVRTSPLNRDYQDSIREHVQIVNALLGGDPDAAEAAALYHVMASKDVAFKYN